MKLITQPITISQLTKEAHQLFGNLIKVVVDIKKEIIKKEQLEESEDFNSISIGTGLLGAALAARKIIKK